MSAFVQPAVMADMICSVETVTGFANDAGGFGTNDNPPAAFTIQLTGLGTDAFADGFLELTTFGDFSNAAEYIDISIEGVSLGRLWDNDTSNDNFAGNNQDDDRGQEYGQAFNGQLGNESALANLTESQLDTFLADGVLNISFDAFGDEVNNLQDAPDPDEFITAKVTIVPEPSNWLIAFLIGIVGTARRRSALL